MDRKVQPWLGLIGILAGAVLLLPGLFVFPMSLSEKRSFKFPPDAWGLNWYASFFSDPGWLIPLRNSTITALCVAFAATVIGTVSVYALLRSDFRGKGLVLGLLIAPMLTPIIIMGVGDYELFLRWKITGSLVGFFFAHLVHAIPYVVITVSGVLLSFDRRLEIAAQSLGASPAKVFGGIVVPVIIPGVLAGFVFAFISSFDETVIALFLSDPNFRTLPVKMYSSMTQEVDPTIAVAASVIMVLAVLLLSLVSLSRRFRRVGA